LQEYSLKFGRLRALLPGLTAGILIGLSAAAAFNWRARSAPSVAQTATAPPDIARLSTAELETLALDALSALREKRGPDAGKELGLTRNARGESFNEQRQIYQGMRNAQRLLPLAKRLTLEALGASLKSSGLSGERRLIASVRWVELDPSLGGTAEVREENLSVIYVGPSYAVFLTSNEDAVLMLGHELTHVAARAGRLNRFINGLAKAAWLYASVVPRDRQTEELACEFIAAQALKRFIALHPTGEADVVRFSRAFGYETPSERLALAWQEFCAPYDGDPGDEEHLSRNQTVRTLLRLDPELKTLVPDDAISKRLCR
jgi:hypothetical protein